MACPLAKKTKAWACQPSWAEDYGFVFHKDRASCFENVVCRTSSVKRHFETKHERSFKVQADKGESITHAVSRCEKPTLSKSLPLPKTMRPRQAFAILNMIVVGGDNDKRIIAIIMR